MRAGWLAMVAVLATVASGAAFAQSQDEQIMKQGPAGGTDTPPPAPADDEELSTTYSSIGLQKVHFKLDGADVKDAVDLDLTLIGFRIPTVPWFGVELNLGFSMIPGEVKSSTGGTSGDPFPGCVVTNTCSGLSGSNSQANLQATTAGVFAVLRSPGKFFAMGKYGYRYIQTNLDGYPPDSSGDAYGLGVGYRWNRKGSYAEFGYTHYSPEISALGFSLSYSYDRR